MPKWHAAANYSKNLCP